VVIFVGAVKVRLFLRFFRNKRETALRVLEGEFADVKHDRWVVVNSRGICCMNTLIM
jgi:hypothetical protein